MIGKAVLWGLVCAAVSTVVQPASGQVTSVAEKTGFWPSGSNWVGGTMPGTLVGGTINIGFPGVRIDGTIQAQANLSLTAFASLTINAGDTLVVLGNMSVPATTVLINNGILVVLGNYSSSLGGTTLVGGTGTMVVTGDYNSFLAPNNNDDENTYVYDDSDVDAGSESDLLNDNPDLHEYVEDMYAILPVTLTSFTSVQDEDVARLTWETASEQNNAYFIIDRSVNGYEFQAAGTKAGNGTTPMPSTYEWVDTSPLPGASYYRLSQVDLNGDTTELKIIAHDQEVSTEIKMYPNPSIDHLIANLPAAGYTVYIQNSAGNAVAGPVRSSSPGELYVSTRTLSPGLYALRVIAPEEHIEPVVLKFFKR